MQSYPKETQSPGKRNNVNLKGSFASHIGSYNGVNDVTIDAAGRDRKRIKLETLNNVSPLNTL